jgi:hypothetical protein
MAQYLNVGDKVVTFRKNSDKGIFDVRVLTVVKTTKTTATLDNSFVLINCDGKCYGAPVLQYERCSVANVVCKVYLEKGEPDYLSARYYEHSPELMAALDVEVAAFQAEGQANLAIGQFIKSLNDKALKFTPELILMLQDTIAKYNETAEKKF